MSGPPGLELLASLGSRRGAIDDGRQRRGGSPVETAAFRRVLLSAVQRSARQPAGLAASNLTARVRRVDQTDRFEYDSAAQTAVWSGSTCSAAALTSVLRAGGAAVRIADVMRAMPGSITPEQGLISRPGLVGAARRFGLDARDDVTSYSELQRATASGQPVLLDVTNAQFPEGHWLVVTGADARGVRVADSSGYRLGVIPRDDFLASWSGRGIRVLGEPAQPAVNAQLRKGW